MVHSSMSMYEDSGRGGVIDNFIKEIVQQLDSIYEKKSI